MFGYYSRLPYLVEATGLTQYSLAKAPLGARGAVGHEKRPDPRWFAEHRIHLLVRQRMPRAADPGVRLGIDQIHFGDLAQAQILLYSDEVMDPLRDRPDVKFTPIETLLARARRTLERAPLARAESSFERLDGYYFRSGGERAQRAERELRAILERRRSQAAR